MRDDLYKLEGTVMIPKDKKAEFNRYILQILDVCGIRKTEKIVLGGQTVTVIRRPMPDEQGIVSFDYSIFEKEKRKAATYNMNTCELITPDRGYREFGIVMNMIMVMQESYSEEHCYFMYEDEPCRVDAYALLIRGVLGIDLRFPNRARTWDMLLYLRNTREYQNVTSEMIWQAYSFDFCDLIPEQFLATLDIESERPEPPEEPFKGEKKDIKSAPRGKLGYYVYQIMEEAVKNKEKESLEIFLRKLLDADLQRRMELAEDVQYGMIAEVSLYVLPSVVVHGYALAIHQNFWDVWKHLGINGYSTTIDVQSNARTIKYEENERYLSFYKVIQRDYEDEFLEFWKNGNLHLSDDMNGCLSEWKEHFTEIRLEEDFNLENFLTQIVIDLDQNWGCRLVDKEFVTEFVEHGEDDNYKRALLFYRELMDKDTWYFPELTKKQAIQWIIRDNRHKFDFTAMSAFQSLLINHKYRYEILGF